jgi:hypothetical protein
MLMTEQILQSIQSIVQLNAAETAAFVRVLQLKKLKKKEFLLQAGLKSRPFL